MLQQSFKFKGNEQTPSYVEGQQVSYRIGTVIAVAFTLILFSCVIYFGGYLELDLSKSPKDWASFATYFSGLMSLIVAMLVLNFVAKSHFLQKAEFENMRDGLEKQLLVDSLLRRQQALVTEVNKVVKLIETKWQSDIRVDLDYSADNGVPISQTKARDLGYYITKTCDLVDSLKVALLKGNILARPELNSDLEYMCSLLKVVDGILTEIHSIDHRLASIDKHFSDGYSAAVSWGITPRIKEISHEFKAIQYFVNPDEDILRNI